MTLEIITADALNGPQHGFFTRHGGASSGVFAGLNCGYGSSDQSEIVKINRTRVAEAMQVAPNYLRTVHQTHSSDVASVTGPTMTGDDAPRADAIVTATKGVALAILTADCQPVLFCDSHAGVIGAAHAGWRGALDGVLEATVAAMENLGADRTQISAVIGPCISQRAYEVGPEFFEEFVMLDSDFDRFFAGGANDRMMFDLPSFGLHQLRSAGVGHASWTGYCTYSDPDRFFSYRRSTHAAEADYGRLISAISL